MKDDEKQFMIDIYKRCSSISPSVNPRIIINEPTFYINHKRAWRILDKWFNRGWYDYGIVLDLGWLTSEGRGIANSIMGKE